MMESVLVGREVELGRLAQLAAAAAGGHGSLVLMSGEAGAGKTALGRAALAAAGLDTIEVAASETPGPAYAPIVAILRAGARGRVKPLGDNPALRRSLAALLPELGEMVESSSLDQQLLLESVAAAIGELARARPLAILIDDIHWADVATLDAIGFLAELLPRQMIMLVATYRSDAVPRGHPVRRLRSELRRKGRLLEMVVEPLEFADTERLLESRFGGLPSAVLATAVQDRTEGIPFFIEEVAAALLESRSLRPGPAGLELDPAAALPLPDSVREAVIQRVDRLPDDLRQALSVAAVAGQEFDVAVVSTLMPDRQAMGQLPSTGLLEELGPGRLAFRHTLIRDALYDSIPWARRQELHRLLADELQRCQASPSSIAAHWLAAGETEAARVSLVAAAMASQRASAYRDAANQLSRALDLWPSSVDLEGRLDALDLLADCAERAGETATAVRALTEVADLLEVAGDRRRYADVERKLAAMLELQGAWERALTARQLAAAAYAAAGEPGEAAIERLASAARLRSAASFRAALELIEVGKLEAATAGRPDLSARLLALEGNVKARAGDAEGGLHTVRIALSQALAANELGAAAEIYQRLADALEHAGDYSAARGTYSEAASFCRTNGAPAVGDVCLACLTMVLRQTGEWDRAVEVSREVIGSPTSNLHALAVAHGVLGSILAHRGQERDARSELHNSNVLARRIGLAAMEIDSESSLARLVAAEGRKDEALERCWRALKRWKRTDCERHYSIPVFRWMATFAAQAGASDLLQACSAALIAIASQPNPEAQAALCHALGEEALLGGQADLAAARFEQALAAIAETELPLERAEIECRAAVAHATAGEKAKAVRRYQSAHRIAKRLRARPLANRIAEEVAALGEKVERRLGRLAASGLGRQGLSPREIQVARLVARGLTSREIGSDLSISPRTVEMHIHRILGKLDCRTRVDITRRAAELGLLG
jgi:ATP/maltotriose-dependent transcriptional regulator MalT